MLHSKHFFCFLCLFFSEKISGLNIFRTQTCLWWHRIHFSKRSPFLKLLIMYIVRWGYQPFQSIEVCWSLYPIYGEWFKPATTLRFNFYASFEHFESALPSLCQASCWSGKTSQKSELAPSNGESQAKKSEMVFSLAITGSSLTWSSAVVGLSKWLTYLHWGTAYHHLAKLVDFLCTNVFKSPDKTFRMRQSFISLLSHQRWIFFSNLYAAQPACLLSFAAFVAKRRDNRGWLPSKFPSLKLTFWSK